MAIKISSRQWAMSDILIFNEIETRQHNPKVPVPFALSRSRNINSTRLMAIEKKKRITVRFEPEDEAWILRKAKAAGLKKKHLHSGSGPGECPPGRGRLFEI